MQRLAYAILGYECLHVGETGMRSAADQEILAFALKLNSVYGDLRRGLSCDSGSLRLQGLSGPDFTRAIQQVRAVFDAGLRRECLVTVKAQKTTWHRASGRLVGLT